MKTNEKSVVYCRVSSQAQVTKGDGLGSQETRCREYAKHKGYSVEEVFYDEGISGKLLDRAKMREMLSYLKKHGKKEPVIVIIDDISRLARDLETHIKLRTAIADAGGKLESPAIEFGEDSDSRLVEHLLASVAAHQREKNAEQVKKRMRARMQNGYWVFNAPCGYKFERKGGGKVLVPDEPAATLVRTALEGFATGRFETQTDIIRFLEGKSDFPRDKYGKIHITRITEMLERVLYTGYMEYKPWGISLQPGKHEALISFETYNKIQERLREKANVPNQPNIHMDFPLRGYVACGSCGKPMTACWSAGAGGTKYPYYLCRNKECSDAKKSIKRDLLEKEFEVLLRDLTPIPDLMYVTRNAVKQIWQQHHDNYQKHHASIRNELRDLDRKIEQFLDRIVEAENASLIRAYETKVTKMEHEKASLEAELAMTSEAPVDFENSFQTVFDFIGNPQKLWHSEDIEDKRLVLKLVFTRPLEYRRKEGFQTPAISLPFALSRGLSADKSAMVVGNGLSSNFNLIRLADDIDRISHLLENPPMEFGQSKNWVW
jgi:site-specific DNA recombinase